MIRVLLPLLLLAPTVAAQEVACNPEGSQAEMNRCALDDFDQADAELNDVYAQAIAGMKDEPVAMQRLITAQRLWIQLRDADLAAQFPLAEGQDARIEYGSIYPLEYAGAKAGLTRQRAAYLRQQFLPQADDRR